MTKKHYILLIFSLSGILLYLPISASADQGCFSIVVGKDASTEGCVIMAHNEDDVPPVMVNHYKIPRRHYPAGEKVKLSGGGTLDQVDQTWAMIWSEIPDLLYSDSYLNEWGVCITSDACPSREDIPEITNGGISSELRRLVAEHARTAREGVRLAGDLVERFGYVASGRTYVICDPEEGWLFCVVNGKHWLAQRVPDDQVAMVANTYPIRWVNLQDEANVLASADILTYAVKRGWWKVDDTSEFDFAAAYANPQVASDSSNFCRQWAGFSHIVREPLALNPNLPFSIVPKEKLTVQDIAEILRDHYEGTALEYIPDGIESPHNHRIATICNSHTQISFIAQLRREPPLEIGLVYWVTLSSPCTSPYIPFYFGIPDFPSGYAMESSPPNLTDYREKVTSPFHADADEAFWTFANFRDKVIRRYFEIYPSLRLQIEHFEQETFSAQQSIETKANELYLTTPEASCEFLTTYSQELYLNAVKTLHKLLE